MHCILKTVKVIYKIAIIGLSITEDSEKNKVTIF